MRISLRAARRTSLRTPLSTSLRTSLRAARRAARRDPLVAHRLAATGFTAEAPYAATLTRTITADMARWRDMVRQTGLSVDG